MSMKRKLWLALAGLVVLASLVVGAQVERFYGQEKVRSYTAATAAVETITAADGQTFSWTTARYHVIVCNAPTSAANIYVKLNAATCNPSASAFDFVLEPGTTWAGFANSNLTITSLTLYADAAVTVGTDVVVTGCD